MDDLAFVQRCLKKDKLAWDEFLDKYSRLIYNYILHVLKVKGFVFAKEQVNDIFQEIFCSLIEDNYKKLKTFRARNGCSLASWLRQVTINFTIDYLRKTKPTVSLDEETDEDPGLKEIIADGSADISEKLSQKDKLKTLRECIDELNKEDRFLLKLHIHQGLKLEELKNYFKVSRAALDMRKSRIIERLRNCFKSKDSALDF